MSTQIEPIEQLVKRTCKRKVMNYTCWINWNNTRAFRRRRRLTKSLSSLYRHNEPTIRWKLVPASDRLKFFYFSGSTSIGRTYVSQVISRDTSVVWVGRPLCKVDCNNFLRLARLNADDCLDNKTAPPSGYRVTKNLTFISDSIPGKIEGH